MDYLKIRHELKETFRAKIRKESGNDRCRKEESSSNDGYGTFFGRSEVVFTGRVMKEYKSLQNSKTVVQQLHKKFKINESGGLLMKRFEQKEKIEKIRESRDYSFLLSNDDDDRDWTSSVRVQAKKTKNFGLEDPRPAGIKEKSSSRNPRNVPPKSCSKKSKSVVVVDERRDLSRKSCDLRKPLGQKRKNEDMGAAVLKKAKKQTQQSNLGADIMEDEDPIDIVRKMFRYDPSKFHDDRDDEKMVASFADIQKEERRSAKIASKEDAQELKKLEREKKRIIVKIKLR